MGWFGGSRVGCGGGGGGGRGGGSGGQRGSRWDLRRGRVERSEGGKGEEGSLGGGGKPRGGGEREPGEWWSHGGRHTSDREREVLSGLERVLAG